jgi:hypothetical protein
MKILNSLKTGMLRSMKLWKGILITWFCSFLLVSIVAIPMKSALNAGFGNSMITEKLSKGINIEVFADLGDSLKNLISYFSGGLFMILLVGFLLNCFLSGGLFSSLKGISGTFSSSKFFIASVKNFRSFFFISLLISLIILSLAIIIVVFPVIIASHSESSPDGSGFRTAILVTSFFVPVLALVLLAADYGRAWQVAHDKNNCFKAIGFGFVQTFRTFFSSYPLMIILLLAQVMFGWLVLEILPGFRPVNEAGIIFLFLLSQMLFFIKILLKTWRYGSVTKMMELDIAEKINNTQA